ncbi:MAG: hypothetical protein Q4G14_10410 [Paracoccus sp. (in: a-proteobacteria)]|uniref:hypothetical protein n=1 Tax=Paracoccus sp. TaxID=267 RepID=UPI0026DEFF61|nr:hypothetical protein [Paracoccus sp. (in: a-proteobacteria)]MDO5613636.1 hypothetical protein [Paracoccus sp. (in: a-proteobacteria)]
MTIAPHIRDNHTRTDDCISVLQGLVTAFAALEDIGSASQPGSDMANARSTLMNLICDHAEQLSRLRDMEWFGLGGVVRLSEADAALARGEGDAQ